MEEINAHSSERPSSRRGIGSSTPFGLFDDTITQCPVAILRPGTAKKPSSALRNGTASRLMATNITPIGSTGAHRIGTSLGTIGNRMTERPITQHGISGLSTSNGRLGTTANGNRQIKDKRYWQAVLQSKIHVINQETSKLLKGKTNLDREWSARKLYEKRAKETAKKLTNLQSTLTSMNLVLDNCSSGMSRQHLLNETVVLRERNMHIQEQLELSFKQRQLKDTENRELEIEIVKEKNKVIEMINSLPDEEKRKFQVFQVRSEQLRKQNSFYHVQISETEKQKERLHSLIMNSQSRSEAHRIKSKLKELVTKSKAMHDEETNALTPAQERVKLINKVRSNNQALVSIGKQFKVIEDQLNEKREIIQQIEHDLSEGNSDRHIKYKELKKRDDIMSTFMESFKTNMDLEKMEIATLKNQISFAIEQITLQGINIKGLEADKLEGETFTSKNDLNSRVGLVKEYKKLGIHLKQLQILEKRTGRQVNFLCQEEAEALHNIQNYSNLEVPRSEAIVKMNDLSSKLQELDDKNRVTEQVVAEARIRNEEVKIKLKNNETYRQISHLEDKLVELIKDNKTMQNIVDQMQQENNYSSIRKEVNDLVRDYNKLLCSEMENVF